jgi:16S rRNA (adenine1518-N6/adenine1519-N6)-dimethyltransferase
MYEANKSLGQNFLTDEIIAQTMVASLSISNGDTVIEIGPGLGALTTYINKLHSQFKFNFIAVDTDQRFIPKLQSMVVDNPDSEIVLDDILKFLPNFDPTPDLKIIGSLPFYITSPILHAIIKMQQRPEKVVIMIQKEVAEKIINEAPDGSYLSTFIQTFYNVNHVVEVPRRMFKPEPEVDASVISLTKKDFDMSREQIEKYEGFLHRAFKNPRKMLNKTFSRDDLKRAEIDPSLRPQAVSSEVWLKFFMGDAF